LRTAHKKRRAAAMERIGTNHEDLIHDVQLDYYGKQLATCSSDRTIKIYDIIDGGERKHVADLKGHDGPVWQIAWAHPMYGNILASCSYDRQVMVWKEHSPHNWAQVYIFREHEGSVNSISWAPKEFGLCLACASSDETIRVLTQCAAPSSRILRDAPLPPLVFTHMLTPRPESESRIAQAFASTFTHSA